MNTIASTKFRQLSTAALVAQALMLAAAPASPAWGQALINPFTGAPMRPPEPAATPLVMPAATPAATPAAVETPAATPTPPAASAPVGNSAAVLAQSPNPGVTLRFDNADIYDVLQLILGDILKFDYIIDPSIQGRITLKSTGAISLADIFNTLEAALAVSNIAIVRQGNVYRVVRDANAVRDTGATSGTGPASMVIQVIPLQFVQANLLVNTLRNFIGPQAAITNDPANRHLIVVDRQANVDKIIEMVKSLDVDYFSRIGIRLIPLSYSEAADLAKELDGLFKTSGILNWSGTEPTKAFFLPVTRMNALLVATSNERLMQAAEQWIKTLDAEPRDGLGAHVHVYPVAHGNAAYLANLVNQIFGGSGPVTPPTGASALPSAGGTSLGSSTSGAPAGASTPVGQQGAAARTIERGNTPQQAPATATAAGSVAGNVRGLGGSLQVIADEITNTLIVRASPRDYLQVRRVLERLDTSPRQVLVQVMVAEITLNDTLQYGVEWWLKSALASDGKRWPGFVGLDGGIAPKITIGSGATGLTTPTVTGTSTGLNYAVFGSAGQVVGLLNLLGQDTDVNVLSTPHVLASDGKIARVEVGNEVPVITQTVSTPTALPAGGSFSTSNSVQYRPTGILLEVKPNITSSGQITLSISQEVSSVGSPVSAGGSEYPSFQKRKVTTDATVENGKTIMLAGLIEDRGNSTVTGVPGLKDVPLFGALFGTNRKVRNKSELLITITPYVVSTREESDRLVDAFQGSLQKLQGLIQGSSSRDLRQDAPKRLTRPGPLARDPNPATTP